MSTTTRALGGARGIARFVGVSAGLLALWLVLVLAITWLFEPADAVLALYPGGRSSVELPPHVSIVTWQGRAARLTADTPGWVGDVYASGALLVLPVRRRSCLDLR
ncbi:MAG: hypothetical protein KDJ80_14040 [Nitratireductor sp.]|nr:hypothetical protein [Nitratireductor sp.]